MRQLPSLLAAAEFAVESIEAHAYVQMTSPDYLLTLLSRGMSEFGLAAGAAGVGFAVSGEGAAATEDNAVIVSQGLIETPPTYFDMLAPAGGSNRVAVSEWRIVT
jgi:hypothetical protein